MLTIRLNKDEEQNVLEGFPWIYNNEVYALEGEIENGQVVRVVSFENCFVCYGFLNIDSKLFVRVLSLDEAEVIDKIFFKKRIEQAYKHRLNLGFNSCRMIFAEADKLPGLVVDKYADVLVVQFLSLGMERIRDWIVELLIEVLKPSGIYERSDMPVRIKEGLDYRKGVLYGSFETKVLIEENGIQFYVDIENGQKTGYFLDQKLNRDILRFYAKDKIVLDAFSNVGGFALHACKYGATQVDACDISKRACDEIALNAKLNGFHNLNTICVDVFDYLHSKDIENKYDVIILDPPAFTKDKNTVKKAYRGYKEINLQALRIIKSGGYLLTFSCSQHFTPELFMDMIKEAVHDAKREVQFLDFRIQAPDHPALLFGKEQLYLKCMILRVL